MLDIFRPNKLIIYLFLIGGFILINQTLASQDFWQVRFGILWGDSLPADDWNFAGVRTGADIQHDIYDIEKFFPPVTRYVVFYFPHRDSLEPDFWPSPYSGDYSKDVRPPLSDSEIWHCVVKLFEISPKNITLFWEGADSIPGDYLPVLISPDNDTINLFQYESYNTTIPVGIHRWQLSMEPDYYEGNSLIPRSLTLYIGEEKQFRFYLYQPDGDSLPVKNAYWRYNGSGGSIDSSGIFSAESPGGGYVIACLGGVCDSSQITVIPGGGVSTIPLDMGWNMVSLPVIPSSNRVEDIFPGYSSYVYSYNPLLGEYCEVESLIAGEGYFVLSTQDTFFSLWGENFSYINKDMNTGWNLIGGPSRNIMFSNFSTIPAGILLDSPYYWNAEEAEYIEVDTLEFYNGCWILSDSPGTLEILSE